MKKKFFLIYILLFVTAFSLLAQNHQGVSISENIEQPHSSAMLEVKSFNKGVKIPEVTILSFTDVSMMNSASISDGLLIFNPVSSASVPKGFYYWDQNLSKWVSLDDACVPCEDEGWKIIGNGGFLANGEPVPDFSNACYPVNTQAGYSGIVINGLDISSLNLQPLSIRKLCNGYVHIKGYVNLSGQIYLGPFLILPNGYKPIKDIISKTTLYSTSFPVKSYVCSSLKFSTSYLELRSRTIDPTTNPNCPTYSFFYIDIMYLAGTPSPNNGGNGGNGGTSSGSGSGTGSSDIVDHSCTPACL